MPTKPCVNDQEEGCVFLFSQMIDQVSKCGDIFRNDTWKSTWEGRAAGETDFGNGISFCC